MNRRFRRMISIVHNKRFFYVFLISALITLMQMLYTSRDPSTDLRTERSVIWGKDTKSIFGEDVAVPSQASVIYRRNKPDVLIITEQLHKSNTIRDSFTLARISMECKDTEQAFDEITNDDIEKNYFLVVIADVGEYTIQTNKDKHDKIIEYCKNHKIGMLIFSPFTPSMDGNRTRKYFHLDTYNVKGIQSFELESKSNIWRWTKAGKIENVSTALDWTSFAPNEEAIMNFRPLVYADSKDSDIHHTVAVEDVGKKDDVRKIFIGKDLSSDAWFLHLLFMDSLRHLTANRLFPKAERYLLVDVENVFQKREDYLDTKLEDVKSFLEVQKDMRAYIMDFKFNLGFMGSYFGTGNEDMVQADNAIMANKDEFWWFPQSWTDKEPHVSNNKTLFMEERRLNEEFAVKNQLAVTPHYTVPPRQSGVYPVLRGLYEVWHEADPYQVTSTTMYQFENTVSEFHPGFYYNGVTVLPRFSFDFERNNVDNVFENIDKQIYSGAFLLQMIYNKVQIIRTRCQYYSGERPAVHALHNLMWFLRQWTNLKLVTEDPYHLAKRHFDLHPRDMDVPLWQNPCLRDSLSSKWPSKYAKNCTHFPFPDAIIAGPQKSGTTALEMFLEIHPSVKVNFQHPVTHEETQFYSNIKIYEGGVEWYMSRFPHRKNNTDYIIEKSATYCTNEKAPERIHALMPGVKVIINILEPTRRSQSHYYHFRYHQDNDTLRYDIQEFFTNEEIHVPTRERILRDSSYITHIENWLTHFPAKQLIFIDGVKLVENPIEVMTSLQKDLDLNPKIDFSAHIRYDQRKEFFCPVSSSSSTTECLGGSKGRDYPALDSKTKQYLHEYFKPYNMKLAKLLQKLERPLPKWLSEYANS